MTRTRTSRAAAKSRRRFLKLAALGSVAAFASAALPAGAARPKPAPARKPAPPARPTGVEAEIERQKKSTADLLKTLRDYELPPGSEMAFAFAPMRAAKRRRPAKSMAGGGAR